MTAAMRQAHREGLEPNGNPSFSADDLANFARLGISPGLLARAGAGRVTDYGARRDFGITFPGDMAGIVFPYPDPETKYRVTARLRRDHPEIDADRQPKNKYICAYGDNRHLYFPPGAGELLRDMSVPVVLVEAEKSALAITALAEQTGRKLLAVATGGCWGWRGKTGIETGPNGERHETRGPLADLDRIEWTGRKVLVAFDSNVATNRKVKVARQALAETLKACGARVFILELPEEVGECE